MAIVPLHALLEGVIPASTPIKQGVAAHGNTRFGDAPAKGTLCIKRTVFPPKEEIFRHFRPEWDRRALEVLREPLESGVVTISRAARQSEFPARFQLVAAMNPCPCGWAGDVSGRCRCSPDAINRYRGRISGPLLDRIDLHVDVPRLPPAELRPDAPGGEPSAAIRTRVEAARALQLRRAGQPNARLGQADTMAACRLSEPDQQLLEHAIDALQLSARAMHRILRVARTIADLAGSESIATAHLTEALGYRGMDARHSARAA